MMIGQLKQGAVTLPGDDRQEPAYLILGEEGDLGWGRSVLAWPHESDSIIVLSDYCYQAPGKYARYRLTFQVGDASYCRIGAPLGP